MKTGKKRVLCVDDNADARELLEYCLSREGFEVICAPTMTEGLLQARGNRFDVYLLDGRFSDGTGLELALQIRSFDPQTPLIFHTANAYAADIQSGLDVGAQAYITKPSDPYEVVKTNQQLTTTR